MNTNSQNDEKAKQEMDNRLRSARKSKKGITQKDIAAMIDQKIYDHGKVKKIPYTEQSVINWEKHGKKPSYNEVYQVYSEISGWSIPYLMGLTKHKTMRDEYQAAADRIDREYKQERDRKKELRDKFKEVVLLYCKMESANDGRNVLKKKHSPYYHQGAILTDYDLNLLYDGLSSIVNAYIQEYIAQHIEPVEPADIDQLENDPNAIEGWWTPPDYYSE